MTDHTDTRGSGGSQQGGPTPVPSQQGHPAATPATGPRDALRAALAGVAVVVALAALTRFLEQTVPAAAKGTAFAGFAAAIEFPVYAILLGLLGNLVLTRLGLRDRLAGGFRTEFFIKTGLVLLGASINFAVILTAAGPAILQALVLISVVFGFTWWLGGRLGLDDRLRALLSSAVSICGISAAIAAAGAVQAKREQLAYTASLVVVFALPSIFLLPAVANGLGLSQAVAGAWIGGNIDTTAAVSAAGALAGRAGAAARDDREDDAERAARRRRRRADGLLRGPRRALGDVGPSTSRPGRRRPSCGSGSRSSCSASSPRR